jgi:hypothetical protein
MGVGVTTPSPGLGATPRSPTQKRGVGRDKGFAPSRCFAFYVSEEKRSATDVTNLLEGPEAEKQGIVVEGEMTDRMGERR